MQETFENRGGNMGNEETRKKEGNEQPQEVIKKSNLDEEQRSGLGWDNETMNLDKINDVELLLATGYDLDFIEKHHIVRALLEANHELAGSVSWG